MLALQRQIDFDAGFGAQTLRAESTWLILTRTCRLVAVDVEQAVVRYVIALPGASTYSKMIVIGDRVIVSRFCDDAYVLLAYALADGRELWRTTLPQKLRLVYEAFLVEHAAALTVLIRTQAFRIDPATGSLLVHVTLPDESAQTATPTGSDRVYVRYRNSFGFLAPDLRAEQLLDESLLEVVAANDQLFVLPRLDDYVAVWDAIEARETARIATRPLGADVQAWTLRARCTSTINTSTMNPAVVLPTFDAYLADRGLRFDSVIIGGSALVLLGVVTRFTDDCDVLDPDIPEAIRTAASHFAKEHGLDDGWLNSRAHEFTSVPGCLPEGWRARLRVAFEGKAMRLETLGHFDLLCTKLVALVDRGIDYKDCVALAPSADDLRAAWPFIVQYEGNDDSREVYWIPTARRALGRLAKELGLDVVL